MYQYKSLDDTIAAIATPAGQGGIGIVRISGPQSLDVADAIFKLKNNQKPSAQKTFTVHYGWLIKEGAIIDEALLTIMRGPKSYTAQDVIEVSCHGGPAILRAALELVLVNGARLAEPGEFTKRAFLNGRIDLAQAEAVLDIISAKTENFARVSQNQLKGELSKELDAIRDELMRLYTVIEAVINFPEDDIDAQGREQIIQDLSRQLQKFECLLSSAHNGRILKEGIRIVLCGKPNVGKSSLLNVLLKQDRAIVTSIAGTTRDVLEESAQIKGVPLQLVDTAGILEPRDLIEEEAVKRSHLFIESADLVLLVLDASRPLDEADYMLIEKTKGRNVLLVLNKSDLPMVLNESALPAGKTVKVSAAQKFAIEELERIILEAVWEGSDFDAHGIMLSNVRHINALKTAKDYLAEALTLINQTASWEIVSQGIKDAVNQLDSITGRNIDQDLLDRIFSTFCIGK
jgi:tRNA modification GTPase